MATQNKPEMMTVPCAICDGDNTRPKVAMLPWCPSCFLVLLFVRNREVCERAGFVVEITPAVEKALREVIACQT